MNSAAFLFSLNFFPIVRYPNYLQVGFNCFFICWSKCRSDIFLWVMYVIKVAHWTLWRKLVNKFLKERENFKRVFSLRLPLSQRFGIFQNGKYTTLCEKSIVVWTWAIFFCLSRCFLKVILLHIDHCALFWQFFSVF